MIRLAARLISRLAGPHCCDCSCGDCPANGHTHTMALFGPRQRFFPHLVITPPTERNA